MTEDEKEKYEHDITCYKELICNNNYALDIVKNSEIIRCFNCDERNTMYFLCQRTEFSKIRYFTKMYLILDFSDILGNSYFAELDEKGMDYEDCIEINYSKDEVIKIIENLSVDLQTKIDFEEEKLKNDAC